MNYRSQNRGRRKKKKPNKQQNKLIKKQHASNTNNHENILMQGFVTIDTGDCQCKKFWSVLRINMLYLYQEKNKIQVPFDVINLSCFDKAQKVDLFVGNDSFAGFGIRLFDKNGNEHNYLYSDHKCRQKWFKLLLPFINGKCNNNEKNGIFQAMGLIQNNQELIFCNISLSKNTKSKQFEMKFNDTIINISNYEIVSVYPCSDGKNDTLFKYELTFKSHEMNDFKCLMKSNNDRMEFFCHLHEIINEKSIKIISLYDDIKNQIVENKEDDIKHQQTENDRNLRDSNIEIRNSKNEDSKQKQSDTISSKKHDQCLHNADRSRECANCTKTDVLRRCSGCKLVYYCNVECQSTHWKVHKKWCNLHRSENTHQRNRSHFDTVDRKTSHLYSLNNVFRPFLKFIIIVALFMVFVALFIDSHSVLSVKSVFISIIVSFIAGGILLTTKAAHSEPESNAANSDTSTQSKFVINCTQKDNNNHNIRSGHFQFGERFTYYECYRNLAIKHFIVPKYNTLKEELLQNPYFKLTNEEYLDYFIEAYHLKHSSHFKNMKAKWLGADNIECGIEEGCNISINHIICLLTYCNNDILQREFKKHCRTKNGESTKQLNERHSFIANWRRFLSECTKFYGEIMKTDESLYCGMDFPLLFDGFRATFYCPLSTTISLTVANNFATNTGIILKLQNISHENSSFYFNVEKLSRYPSERERLFVCSCVKIVDIIMNGQSNSDIVTSFHLLELILRGNIFLRKPTNKVQLIMLKFVKNYVTKTQNDNYFQMIFNNTINSYLYPQNQNHQFMQHNILTNSNVDHALFMNEKQLEWSLSNKELLSYFLSWHKFKQIYVPGLLFNERGKIKIRLIKEIGVVVLDKKQVRQLKNGTEIVKSSRFTFGVEEMMPVSFVLKFQFETRNDQYGCFINMQSLPSHIQQISILYDIICKELKFEQIQYSATLSERQPMVGYPAFTRSELLGLKSLKFQVTVRIV
eukprot:220473_1